MPFAVKAGQTVVFTGDSITDCGRRGPNAPYGAGYVSQVRDMVMARYPNHLVNIINTGIGGNTVRDLEGRWNDDVVRHQPDWLSVKIGINDLHRWLAQTPEAISPEDFADIYDGILARAAKETPAKLVLVDPFYMSTETSPASFRSRVLKELPKYIKTVDKLARKYKARHVQTHELFKAQLKHHVPDVFCAEPVHPNLTGHMLIAHGWLKAMGW